MLAMPTGFINQAQLASEIDRVARKLGPGVVRLRHSLGADAGGEPAVHFRILLTDAASRRETLADVSGDIVRVLFEELRPLENWGLYPYFRFRSQSEQLVLNDPAWE